VGVFSQQWLTHAAGGSHTALGGAVAGALAQPKVSDLHQGARALTSNMVFSNLMSRFTMCFWCRKSAHQSRDVDHFDLRVGVISTFLRCAARGEWWASVKEAEEMGADIGVTYALLVRLCVQCCEITGRTVSHKTGTSPKYRTSRTRRCLLRDSGTKAVRGDENLPTPMISCWKIRRACICRACEHLENCQEHTVKACRISFLKHLVERQVSVSPWRYIVNHVKPSAG